MFNNSISKPSSYLKLTSWAASLVVGGLFLQRIITGKLPDFLFFRYRDLLLEHATFVLFLPAVFLVSAFVLYTFKPDASVSDMKKSFLECFTSSASVLPVVCLMLILLGIVFGIFGSLWLEYALQSQQ